MPSVKLATFLCFEKFKKNSFWKPFFDVLPATFDLPLFWTIDELLYARKTFLFEPAVQIIVNTLMQYIYIYRAIDVRFPSLLPPISLSFLALGLTGY